MLNSTENVGGFLSRISSKLHDMNIFGFSDSQEGQGFVAMREEIINQSANDTWFLEEWFATPISYITDSLEIIHFGLGLPWYATIAITAVSIRLAAIPPLVINMQQISSAVDAQPIISLIQDEWKRKKKNLEFEDGKKQSKNISNSKEIKLISESNPKKDRISAFLGTSLPISRPTSSETQFFKQLYGETTEICGFRAYRLLYYPAVLVSTILPFTFAARAILRRSNHDLNEGGLLWFTDLAQADIHCILPFVATGLTCLVLCYRSGKMLDGRVIGIFSIVRKFYYCFCCISIFSIASVVNLPAGIFMYWIPFALVGLLSKNILVRPSVRSRLGMPAFQMKTEEPKDPRLRKYYHELMRKFRRIHSSRPSMVKTNSKPAYKPSIYK